MDFANDLILQYGGFGDDKEININHNIEEITKIIKYGDYKNNNIIKLNDIECSICLEEFNNEETTHGEIINLIKKYFDKKKLECINEYEHDKTKINQTCIISCYHVFHKKCLLEWYKKNISCPICRKNLNKIK